MITKSGLAFFKRSLTFSLSVKSTKTYCTPSILFIEK
ncbi:hypothetical protein [Sulfolobus tengchongensis spindle-shaped virus 4]|nr:hypothetical protein [Sulfolobus tengchongensis spindle-shaped virus 4]